MTPSSLRFPMAHLARARALAVALALVALVLVGGCSAVSKEARTSIGVAPSAPAPAPERGEVGSAAPAGFAAQDSAGGGGLALPEVDITRSVIRTGSLDLEVRSVPEAIEAARQIATAAGGSVTDSTFTGDRERQSAMLTLRVPTERFADVIAQLQQVAVEVRTVSTNSHDVTEQITDIEATLRNLRAVESQYQQLLSRANTIGDVLQVQDRLNQTRLQIDRTEARRQTLASQTDMATLTVSLRPTSSGGGTGLLDRVREAWTGSLDALEEIATTVLVVLVFFWWVWPVAGVVAWILIRQMRRTSTVAPGTPTPGVTGTGASAADDSRER